MRTLLWILAIALMLSGSATAVLAQEEEEEAEVPEASEPHAKKSVEQQHDEEGSDLGASTEPSSDEDEAEPEESAPTGDAKPVSIGLLLGYGLSFEKTNPWGLGFGLRGGYNLDAIYLGARFVYYLGGTDKTSLPSGGTIENSRNIWEFGVEAGYDFEAGESFVVRPELGLGVASLNSSTTVPGALGGMMSNSSQHLFLAPGVAALFDVSQSVFLGIDARLMFIMSTAQTTGTSTVKGLMLLANGGMRF